MYIYNVCKFKGIWTNVQYDKNVQQLLMISIHPPTVCEGSDPEGWEPP